MPGSALLVTVSEAAELAGIGKSTVYQLCQKGIWPAVKIGRSVRIHKKLLEKWVEDNTKNDAVSLKGEADESQ